MAGENYTEKRRDMDGVECLRGRIRQIVVGGYIWLNEKGESEGKKCFLLSSFVLDGDMLTYMYIVGLIKFSFSAWSMCAGLVIAFCRNRQPPPDSMGIYMW